MLVVGASIASAALVFACSSDSDSSGTPGSIDAGPDTVFNPDGPVGNTALPHDTGHFDAGADTVFNPDGPVGNTALPHDTGYDDVDSDSADDSTVSDGG